jgi:hypothetical protein
VVNGLFEIGTLSDETRLLLAVGFLGGYTTFSTFSYDTLKLLSDGAVGPVLLNTLGQLLAGLVAVLLGALVVKALIRTPTPRTLRAEATPCLQPGGRAAPLGRGRCCALRRTRRKVGVSMERNFLPPASYAGPEKGA